MSFNNKITAVLSQESIKSINFQCFDGHWVTILIRTSDMTLINSPSWGYSSHFFVYNILRKFASIFIITKTLFDYISPKFLSQE